MAGNVSVHYRYAHSDDGIQRRYFELRYDADERKVSGVAMRYGDTATLPWGEKERFEPGAFGEVGGLDVILNVQHDRGRPIARTTGGTMRLSDSAGELRIEATLPETTEADNAIANIRAGILRGFSVEFKPEETDRDGDTIIVKKAKLPGIGLVDRPAYPKSRVQSRSEGEMNESEIKALVERAVKEETEKRVDSKPDAAAITAAVSGAVAARMATMVTAERAQEMVTEAVEKRAAELEADFEKRMGDHKKAMKKKADEDEEMMAKKADDRAELLVAISPLLPKGTETRGQSDHALLVLAVGDEVPDAAKRSEDYLLAKVEAIAERRAAAAKGATIVPVAGTPAGQPGGVNMTRFIESRTQRRQVAANA